ncbi:peptidylprolyl isomerase [Arenimonas sp.]|uniref:peptidylprolyl isomerase n=1 Tax=Arenimonas sp. TaxID=1872635 RepID=UPI0039E4FBBE
MNPKLKPLASLLAGLALLGSAAAVHAQALPTTHIDSIAAVVDETVILRSELERAVANITSQYASQPEQLPPRDILEKQVLDRLILLHLQVQRANDSGIRIADTELQQAVGSIASQNNLTVDQLRQRLAADGLSFDEFRANLRDEITVQRLRQRYMQSAVQISEAEIDQALSAQQFGGEEMHLANIQINLPEGATPDEIAAAREKLAGIKASIERGEIDFRSAAIRHSQAQNALDGGEIGWRAMEAVPPVFVNLLRDLQPGQITDPVRGQSGFQIVQMIEKRTAQAQMVTQYRASDIMVRISDLVNAEAARQKIEALRARVVGGEDFAKVAKEASENTITRNSGGDMGWFVADQWGSAIATQITALQDGEVSPIFQSEVGFHFIKRTGNRQQDLTADNQRNRAREVIGQRKGEEAYERFLRNLRSEAYVETRLGGS